MSLGFSLYIWLFVLGQISLNNIERRQPPSLSPSLQILTVNNHLVTPGPDCYGYLNLISFNSLKNVS
jgi:hypothetical protein